MEGVIKDKFGFLYLIGFFSLLFLIFSGTVEIGENVKDMANVLIGVLATGLIKIMDFRYGSSLGSKQKTAALSRMNERKEQ